MRVEQRLWRDEKIAPEALWQQTVDVPGVVLAERSSSQMSLRELQPAPKKSAPKKSATAALAVTEATKDLNAIKKKIEDKTNSDKKRIKSEVSQALKVAKARAMADVKKEVQKDIKKEEAKDKLAEAQLEKVNTDAKQAEKTGEEEKRKLDNELEAEEEKELDDAQKSKEAEKDAEFEHNEKHNEKDKNGQIKSVDKKVQDAVKFFRGKAQQERQDIKDALKKQDRENKAALKDAAAVAKNKAATAAKALVRKLEETEDDQIMAKVEKWATEHAKEFARKTIDELGPPPTEKAVIKLGGPIHTNDALDKVGKLGGAFDTDDELDTVGWLPPTPENKVNVDDHIDELELPEHLSPQNVAHNG
jgi:hypothetical protein